MLNLSNYLEKIQNSKEKNYLIIFGAGTIGKLTLEALKIKNIKVDFFAIVMLENKIKKLIR